uniref:Uncharacterized protein n=1 Tax=Steinernema glaseri TaxID=37863 RepID=A0A1I7Y2B3_9BILA
MKVIHIATALQIHRVAIDLLYVIWGEDRHHQVVDLHGATSTSEELKNGERKSGILFVERKGMEPQRSATERHVELIESQDPLLDRLRYQCLQPDWIPASSVSDETTDVERLGNRLTLVATPSTNSSLRDPPEMKSALANQPRSFSSFSDGWRRMHHTEKVEKSNKSKSAVSLKDALITSSAGRQFITNFAKKEIHAASQGR